MKKMISFLMTVMLILCLVPVTARADSSKVVTIGANLSDEQVDEMYEYFGTTPDEVITITVNNQDERKYMEGIATEEQIGTRTYSCSYVEPTTDGGINVKVANLTFVTSSMIASTLLTAGMENCNVIAASPIEVSGTGALTGIMMAYETASGEALSEEQKETATEELITTGELADEIGQDEASEAMNAIKEEVVEDGLTDTDAIRAAVEEALAAYDVSDDLIEQITDLMAKIAQYDLDVNALKDTMDNLSDKGFFANLWDSIKGFFSGDSDNIIDNVNDSVLENNDSSSGTETTEHYDETIETDDSSESLWDRIVNWFRNLFDNLFGNDKSETSEDVDIVEVEVEPEEEADVGTEENTPDNENTESGFNIVTEETETFETEDITSEDEKLDQDDDQDIHIEVDE